MGRGYIEADGSYNERPVRQKRETKDERIKCLYEYIESLKEQNLKSRTRADKNQDQVNRLRNLLGPLTPEQEDYVLNGKKKS